MGLWDGMDNLRHFWTPCVEQHWTLCESNTIITQLNEVNERAPACLYLWGRKGLTTRQCCFHAGNMHAGRSESRASTLRGHTGHMCICHVVIA